MTGKKLPEKNIVLLHGWGASLAKLEPLERALTKLRWHAVGVKLPGFDAPAPRAPWGTRNYAAYVLQEAHKVFRNKKFFVFGHSFGGRVAITIGSLHPKNLQGVVLCAPGGLARPPKFRRGLFWLAAKAGKLILAPVPGPMVARRLLYKLAGEHDYEKTNGVMRETIKKVINENLKESLTRIKRPTLVLWGTADRMTPLRKSRASLKNLRTSRLILFEGQGHRLPYRKPKKVAWEIDQWSRQQD